MASSRLRARSDAEHRSEVLREVELRAREYSSLDARCRDAAGHRRDGRLQAASAPLGQRVSALEQLPAAGAMSEPIRTSRVGGRRPSSSELRRATELRSGGSRNGSRRASEERPGRTLRPPWPKRRRSDVAAAETDNRAGVKRPSSLPSVSASKRRPGRNEWKSSAVSNPPCGGPGGDARIGDERLTERVRPRVGRSQCVARESPASESDSTEHGGAACRRRDGSLSDRDGTRGRAASVEPPELRRGSFDGGTTSVTGDGENVRRRGDRKAECALGVAAARSDPPRKPQGRTARRLACLGRRTTMSDRGAAEQVARAGQVSRWRARGPTALDVPDAATASASSVSTPAASGDDRRRDCLHPEPPRGARSRTLRAEARLNRTGTNWLSVAFANSVTGSGSRAADPARGCGVGARRRRGRREGAGTSHSRARTGASSRLEVRTPPT